MLDLSPRDVDVGDLVDSLLGVENVRSFQDEGLSRRRHGYTPCGAEAFPLNYSETSLTLHVNGDRQRRTFCASPTMRDPARYDYFPLVDRPRIRWPNGARIAFWVCPNIEFYE